jgi:hypothetical protein
MFGKIRERKIWKQVVEGLKHHKFVRGLFLNNIKQKASMMLLNGQISQKFYTDIFCNKNTDYSHSWYELNEEKILNYYN